VGSLSVPEILPVVPAHNIPSEITSRQMKTISKDLNPDTLTSTLYGKVVSIGETAVTL
jgi:hypothetical protein